MSRLLLGYAAAQVGLIPACCVSLWLARRWAGVRFQWALHAVVLVAGVVLPLALLAPLPPGVPQVTVVPMQALAAQTPQALVVSAVAPAGPAGVSPWAVLPLALWGASAGGLAVFAGRLARQKAREARLARAGTTRRIRTLRLVVSEEIAIPFSSGILRPTVFLPGRMSASDRRMVMAHEGEHLRRGHYLWTLAEAALAGLFWYNPLTHLLARDGVRIRELLCDAEAVRRCPRVAYGRLLLETVERASGVPAFANGWNAGRQFMERVKFVLGCGRKERRGLARAGAVTAALLSAVLLSAALPLVAQAGAPSVPSLRPVSAGAEVARTSKGSVRGVMTIAGAATLTGDHLSVVGPGAVTISSTTDTTVADELTIGDLDGGGSLYWVDGDSIRALATADSIVMEVRRDNTGKYRVALQAESGYDLLYVGLRDVTVALGDRVRAGQEIGLVAGQSSPRMLYYRVSKDGHAVDPFAK